jgi:hypothetical protein
MHEHAISCHSRAFGNLWEVPIAMSSSIEVTLQALAAIISAVQSMKTACRRHWKARPGQARIPHIKHMVDTSRKPPTYTPPFLSSTLPNPSASREDCLDLKQTVSHRKKTLTSVSKTTTSKPKHHENLCQRLIHRSKKNPLNIKVHTN